LNLAVEKIGCDVIDFSLNDVRTTMNNLLPGGPDICIDCAGFRYTDSLLHKVERALHLELDSSQILTDAIFLVRKAGTVVVIGDYFGTTNHFPIGAFMEKGLTMRGGQVYVQKYWKHILGILEKDEFDPTFIITHTMPLDRAEEAYRMFDKKEDGSIKILLKP